MRALGAFIITIALTLLLVLVGAVLALRWLDPPTSAFMLETRVQAELRGDRHYHAEYQWRSLEQISPQAALAVIASEDQQFPFHAGFDFTSIREAVRAHERGARAARCEHHQSAGREELYSSGPVAALSARRSKRSAPS